MDPDAFLGLPRLRELRIEENGLRSLANLGCLASLQVGAAKGERQGSRTKKVGGICLAKGLAYMPRVWIEDHQL